MNIDSAINFTQLLLTTAESLSVAIAKSKQSLEECTIQIKEALSEAEKMRSQIAIDRKTADEALDRKFDHSGEAL